ncbi:D-aminopeptidase, partial [Phaeovulum sp.]|uniref:D-aminopeptidase n=1 Tax=Phaeovulum sp. TaxID=2934796 RepID=UPI00356940A4
MSDLDIGRLESVLNGLAHVYQGPGGVAGVVKNGEIVAARAWGFADLTKRRVMSRHTRLPICSISKQFTCAVLLAKFDEPDLLDARVAEYLPGYQEVLPTVRQLCHNQSGLRDYWALTVLQGAMAEQTFTRKDALTLFAKMRTGHFAPGTGNSYSNGNFRIISEILEKETNTPLETLYQEEIWKPAGMDTAELTSNTRYPADQVVGYEGNDATGFFPADNGIEWIGDAGISAALDDMLAYEIWIDKTREDPDGLYNRLSAPVFFADGKPAHYGFGLSHRDCAGVKVTGHGGALRGFRAYRMHAVSERTSVVVMFNHESSAHAAAIDLMSAALGYATPAPVGPAKTPQGFAGQWICPETGLLAQIKADEAGLSLHFAMSSERLVATSETSLEAPGVSISKDGDRLIMRLAYYNLTTSLARLVPTQNADGSEIAGTYGASELDATMAIEARDGGVYACFTGFLGTGRMERM